MKRRENIARTTATHSGQRCVRETGKNVKVAGFLKDSHGDIFGEFEKDVAADFRPQVA